MVKKFTAVVEGNIYICFSEMTKFYSKTFTMTWKNFKMYSILLKYSSSTQP